MTPDERLAVIETKLQGVTETLEVLASMQKDNEARFSAVARAFEVALDSIKRLENIAVADENRLDHLEGDGS